ncbi:hypothetical protein A2866_03415 [Candidatus Roizmanbacteria bacterium RIFCSPHIGHO2_01_FULL_39_8]|uniref:Uncharacterized protein n=1 Tax=Candidatus Roizmanbacteria bacterium RIFCSPHIGHO2_01_FULL_39_8 TaxID=1802033 RepID=A0A1F7GT03_9BACT|nr:MAG: hypothetical protein A2866_03415 [Candidatus Roizmanbacteria bacterium RIFCSPHIGHO2_01_FULL_39_8]
MHRSKKIVITVLYIIIVAISMGAFFIFQPFSFVDNGKSKIACDNGSSFEIGPNFIYTFTDKIDSFNDAKARKICAYNIIRDYGNAYKTPQSSNYGFKPVYIKNSSWGDAWLILVATFLLGSIFIQGIKRVFFESTKDPLFTEFFKWNFFAVVFIFLGIILFLIVIRKPARHIHCQLQIAQKVVNFRNSAFQGGIIPIPEENAHINSSIKTLYETCIGSL